jgi:hypothetical protein
MGSSSCHRPKGITHKEFYQGEFGDNCTVLEASQKRGGALYLAVRHEKDSPHGSYKAGDVFACVVLNGWSPRSYFNYWHKVMDETCGPNEAEAPRKILDLLTPLDELYGPAFIGPMKQYQSAPGQHAREWRQACQDRLARKAAQPKVTAGMTIKFGYALSFGGYGEYDTFVYVKGSTFTVPGVTNGYGYPLQVRIRNWREKPWSAATPEAAVEQLEANYVV